MPLSGWVVWPHCEHKYMRTGVLRRTMRRKPTVPNTQYGQRRWTSVSIVRGNGLSSLLVNSFRLHLGMTAKSLPVRIGKGPSPEVQAKIADEDVFRKHNTTCGLPLLLKNRQFTH